MDEIGADILATGGGDTAFGETREIGKVAAIGGQCVGARAPLGAHHLQKGFDQAVLATHGADLAFFRRRFVLSTLSCMRNLMTLNRTIALVGMMGAGKTSVGRRLAQRL